LVLVLSFSVFATAQQEEALAEESEPTIVEVAQDDGRFIRLVAALEAADLAETLQGAGPFTAFAATDDAFAALPEGTLGGLLANPDQLADVLTYHVVSGRVFFGDVVNIDSATTV
jgi:uncharacterized surface protein with fasciclin (FAS1) repeats